MQQKSKKNDFKNLLADRGLNPRAKLTFTTITMLSEQKGYCFASNGYLANSQGCSKVTISRCISELQKAGYIRIEQMGSERRIVPLSKMIRVINNDDTAYQNGYGGLIKCDNHNNTESVKDKEKPSFLGEELE